MNIRPLSSRITVKLIEEDKETGVVIPENFRQRSVKGTVISVGSGNLEKDGTRRPMVVEPGDVVVFGYGVGEMFGEGDDAVLMMYEEDILGVYTK